MRGFSFDQLSGRKRPEESARGCGVAVRTRLLALRLRRPIMVGPSFAELTGKALACGRPRPTTPTNSLKIHEDSRTVEYVCDVPCQHYYRLC